MKGAIKDVFTTGEVARICRVAPRTVSKWFDRGALRGYRIPMSEDRRVTKEELIRFVKQTGMPESYLAGIVSPENVLLFGLHDTMAWPIKSALESVELVPRFVQESFEVGALLASLKSFATIVVDLSIGRLEAGALAACVARKPEMSRVTVVAISLDSADALPGFHAMIVTRDKDPGVIAAEIKAAIDRGLMESEAR
jgi:Helix-turn-helix domain